MKRSSKSKPPKKPDTKCQRLSNSPDVIAYASANRDEFNDVKICCDEGATFQANKLILSCCSKFFESEFLNEDDNRDVVEVPGVKEREMKAILDYIYTKHININFDNDNVYMLLSAAVSLGVDDVKELCFEFLKTKINPNNCIAIHSVATKYHNDILKKEVSSFIGRKNNFDKVVSGDSFKNLTEADLRVFIRTLNQNQVPETLRYELLSEWTQHDQSNRTSQFANLVLLINFNKLHLEKCEDVFKQQDSHTDQIAKNKPLKSNANNPLQRGQSDEVIKGILSLGGIHTMKNVIAVGNPICGANSNLKFPHLPEGRFWGCAETRGDFIYFVGGHGKNGSVTSTVWRLNTNTCQFIWEEVSNLNEPRCQMEVAVFQGSMCVFGGLGEKKNVLSSGEYLSGNSWKNISPMQHERAEHGLVVCQGSLYAIGGYVSDDQALASVECLHSIDGQWRYVSPMQTPRYRLVAVEYRGFIYAIGGREGWNRGILKSAEKYDVAKNEWTYISDMNIRRTGFAACVINGRILVFGGYDGERIVREIEYYEPLVNQWFIVGETENKLLHHSLVALRQGPVDFVALRQVVL